MRRKKKIWLEKIRSEWRENSEEPRRLPFSKVSCFSVQINSGVIGTNQMYTDACFYCSKNWKGIRRQPTINRDSSSIFGGDEGMRYQTWKIAAITSSRMFKDKRKYDNMFLVLRRRIRDT